MAMTPQNADIALDATLSTSPPPFNKELHVAPMLKVSYPEFRYFVRLLSRRAILWTEMVVDDTLEHTDTPKKFLELNPIEHPVVFQIGGNHPEWTFNAVKTVIEAGFDEVNLNAECPSSLVCGKHEFGAALMKNVNVAVEMLQSMREASAGRVPISIKTRIAIDDLEDVDDYLIPFIQRLVEEAGCRRFYLHARKVYTEGLTCKKNRLVPPLNYPAVYRVCRHFEDCEFWINGGIMSLENVTAIAYGAQLHDHPPIGTLPCSVCKAAHGSCIAPPADPAPPNLRGCMLGRAVMEQPAIMALVDTDFYGEPNNPSASRREVLEKYCTYLEQRHPPKCDSLLLDTTQQSTTTPSSTTDATFCCPVCGYDGKENFEKHADEGKSPAYSSSRLFGKMIKPTMGLFHGIRGGRSWPRIIHALAKDEKLKECGPAFCLRLAMQHMPDRLLDLEFTEMRKNKILKKKA